MPVNFFYFLLFLLPSLYPFLCFIKHLFFADFTVLSFILITSIKILVIFFIASLQFKFLSLRKFL